jgi:hypothetical protein
VRRPRRGFRTATTVCIAATLMLVFVAGPAQADIVLRVHPHSGPPGTEVHIRGTGLPPVERRCGLGPAYSLSFEDASGTRTGYGFLWDIQDGAFHVDVNIPRDAVSGPGRVILIVHYRGRSFCQAADVAKKRFKVTVS